MALTQEEIRKIVEEALASYVPVLNQEQEEDSSQMGIFRELEDAIAAAGITQKRVQAMPLDLREQVIKNIRLRTRENAKLFAELAVKRNRYGKYQR